MGGGGLRTQLSVLVMKAAILYELRSDFLFICCPSEYNRVDGRVRCGGEKWTIGGVELPITVPNFKRFSKFHSCGVKKWTTSNFETELRGRLSFELRQIRRQDGLVLGERESGIVQCLNEDERRSF